MTARAATAAVALATLAIAAPSASAQDVVSSSFAQLTGKDACLIQVPSPDSPCRETPGLIQAEGVAVSPDQKHVYVASSGTPQSGSNAVVVFTRDEATGALTQTSCVSDDGSDGRLGTDGICADGDALSGANDVAITPDGAFVYVSASSSHGVAAFARDAETGALTQVGCAKAFPRRDRCVEAIGLLGANGVAVSPDGLNVYATAGIDDSVVTLTRDPETGALISQGCVSRTGHDGACTDGTALNGASSVAVSPDDAHVYVTAARINAVTTYDRDPETGALTPAGCLLNNAPRSGACEEANGLAGAASVALAPDGNHLYVAASYDGGLVTFARDAASGKLTQSGCLDHQDARGDDQVDPPDDDEDFDDDDEEEEEEDFDDEEELERLQATNCGPARAIYGISEVLVSPDGRSVFTAGPGSLAAFDRDPDTGALSQVGCAEEYRTYKSCADAIGLYGASGLASSDDGRSLYVASRSGNTVAVFGATTAITSRASRVARGRATVRIACPKARARGCRGRLTVGARGPRFALRRGTTRTMTIRLSKPMRRTLRRHNVRVTVKASDSRRLTRASARRITLRRAG